MDKNIVNEMIDELKDSDTTYQNCNDLAALCMVRDEFDKVEEEIDDILPAYKMYANIKAKYKQGQANKDSVIDALNLVCKETFDLIKMLYSCSDMPLERVKIQNMVEAAHTSIGYH